MVIISGLTKEILRDTFKEAFREEIRRQIFEWKHPVVSYSGFKYRILFYSPSYSPHYAEHVVDPLDGREKLVMAIPHTTQNAGTIIIYDIENDVIEWKVDLKTLVSWNIKNPPMAHMIVDEDRMNLVTGSWVDVLGLGKLNANPGDIIAPSPDNTWVVIDRKNKNIKQRIVPGYGSGYVHDILPSVGKDGFIVTDYQKGVYKIDFNGSVVWSWMTTEGGWAKLSKLLPIFYSGGHGNSYGGNYLVVKNGDVRGVYEINDNAGVANYCGSEPRRISTVWLLKPHSAFRTGLVEATGNLTIVGHEAGGGIVAIDRDCRPRWGIMKPYSIIPYWNYRPTSFGLFETTHVFPTLRGTIGFVDWSGVYGSVVGEVVEIPYHQTLWFLLAQEHDPGDNGTYYDPLIDTAEWSTVKLFFVNIGNNSLDYTVYATNIPNFRPETWPSHWKVIANGSVSGTSIVEVDASGYLALRVFGKRSTIGSSSQWSIFVVFRR